MCVYVCVLSMDACMHVHMCGHAYMCMLMGRHKAPAGGVFYVVILPSRLRQTLLLILEMGALASLLAQGILDFASMCWDYGYVVHHPCLTFKWVWGTEVHSPSLHRQCFIY